MDSSQTIAHVSLCAGYAGIDLGLKRAIPHLRTVAFSEIEGFACANLVSKMEAGLLDPAPIWTNLKTFPWDGFRGRVDILSGGYPCQPFSAAGKRLGADDPRHLWPFIADGIARMQPRLCFFENVEGHISLGLENVLTELQGLGYSGTFGIFSASEVGAPHQRKRIFILAHRDDCGSRKDFLPTELRANGSKQSPGDSGPSQSSAIGEVEGQPTILADSNSIGSPESGSKLGSIGKVGQGRSNFKAHSFNGAWPSRPGQPQHNWEPPRVVGNASGGQNDRRESRDMAEAAGERRCGNDAAGGTSEAMGNTDCGGQSFSVHAGCGIQEACGGQNNAESSEPWQAQPTLGGDADGPAGRMDYGELCVACDNRTDELRLLGNGVVPATAELAFRTLFQRLLINT